MCETAPRVLVWTLLAVTAGAAGGQGPKAKVVFDSRRPVLKFAAEELKLILGKCGSEVVGGAAAAGADWTFRLGVDPKMAAYSFSVAAKAGQVVCRGADATCVLHAVYTALERLGVCFEVTGPVVPDRPAWKRLAGWSATVRPAVLRRGVRQHLNFPMDISAYSLAEAKQYVRNLARLRMNFIVFHSYGGHWYAAKLSRRQYKAGVFFYGIRYDIPDDPIVRKVVRNKKVFCIPEIEAFYDRPAERGRRAMGWLRAVIDEAKRVGMTVRFSAESYRRKMADSLAVCDSVLKAYPRIDSLELITPETLESHDRPVSLPDVRARIMRLLNPPPATSPAKQKPKPKLSDFFDRIAHSLEVTRALEKRRGAKDAPLELSIGIYCPARRFQRAAVPLLRELVPKNMTYAILPAHGARAVAANIKAIPLTAEDWRRAMVYSWVEFDGSMFLQQNPVEGIRQLIVEGRRVLGDEPIWGIVLCHWRTAENRTAFRYAARALIEGPLAAGVFYRQHAGSLGVAPAGGYAASMAALDEADNRVRDELFNIGFCFYGCWGLRGLGYIGGWKRATIDAAAGRYEDVGRQLARCLAATRRPAGREHLALLTNRVECTVLHLKSMAVATKLQPICKDKKPAELSDEDRARVREICDRSLKLMDDYKVLHAKAIADRGCEGTLINYLTVTPVVLRRIRRDYGEGDSK